MGLCPAATVGALVQSTRRRARRTHFIIRRRRRNVRPMAFCQIRAGAHCSRPLDFRCCRGCHRCLESPWPGTGPLARGQRSLAPSTNPGMEPGEIKRRSRGILLLCRDCGSVICFVAPAPPALGNSRTGISLSGRVSCCSQCPFVLRRGARAGSTAPGRCVATFPQSLSATRRTFSAARDAKSLNCFFRARFGRHHYGHVHASQKTFLDDGSSTRAIPRCRHQFHPAARYSRKSPGLF